MRSLIWLALFVLGCGDGGGGSSTGGGLVLGKAPKGTVCKSSDECAEPEARCRLVGDISVCTGSLADGAFEQECAGATQAAAEACPGFVCISLKTNKEGKSGICSAACLDDAECGSTGLCLPVLGASYCLGRCSSTADCSGGFSCVNVGGGNKACLVTT